MVVEINLLPKKERKNKTLLILWTIFLLCFLFGAIYLYISYQSAKSEVELLKNELETTKQLRAIQEQKLAEIRANTTIEELKSTIEWTEQLPVSTVSVLDHLTSLLPERGFILNINYSDVGTVHLTVQFDTSREVAYYLNRLEESEVITSVDLSNVTTKNDSIEGRNNTLEDLSAQKLVPRYLANYELQLNLQKLKEIANKEDEQ